MGEPLQEQIEYGSWCMHGQPLGTPGGADLMCGYCEDGLTRWVDDIMYGLAFTYGDLEEWTTAEAARLSRTKWWASEDPEEVWSLIRQAVMPMADAIDGSLDDGEVTPEQVQEFYNLHRWQAVELRAGYWTEPVPEGATR